LDLIEQTQRNGAASSTAFSYPEKPHLIITASRDMGRSASTWVFNAVRLLFREARVACDSYWIRTLSKEKLQRRLENSRAHVLIKTHEWTGGALSQEKFDRELVPMFTHVIVSVREGFSPDPAWMKVASYVVNYEDIVADNTESDISMGALSVLRGLAQHLGISDSLSDDDIRAVDYKIMTLPIPGDQSSKFWSFHARRGGRLQPKKRPATVNVFVTRHGARIDNGSDSDTQWLRKAAHGRRNDAHLSPSGHQAALELAADLVRRQEKDGITLDHIVSSPFVRCIETANAVAEAIDRTIKVEPGIAEVGSSASQMASQTELEAQFPRIDPDYSPVMPRDELPKSEWSDGAAAYRAAKVAKQVHSSLGGNVLFIGHGASCLGLVQAFGAEGYVGYCSLSHFQWTSDGTKGGTWRLVGRLGEVSHLSDPQTALDSAW
jgi:broad specificity phosphatase PhoE